MLISPAVLLFALFLTEQNIDEASASESRYFEELDSGVEAFYMADWEKAESIFQQLILNYPDRPEAYFFRAMKPFWTYFFAGEEAAAADEFLNQSERAITVTKRRLEEAPDDTTSVLMLGGLYGYRSLVAANEGHYRTAMSSGIDGYRYSRKLMGMESNDPNALIGQGVFNYMSGTIPRSLRWLGSIAGVSGEKNKGFELLEKASKDGSKVSGDARMILTYLYLKEDKPEEAVRVIEPLCEQFPDNPIFQFYLAKALEASGKNSRAAEKYLKVVELDHPSLQHLKDKSRDRLQMGSLEFTGI